VPPAEILVNCMGMSTHVVGFKPPDKRYKSMAQIWTLCEKQHIPVPEEVEEFFHGERPSDAGMEVDLSSCVEEYTDDERAGIQLHVGRIPDGVKMIRFWNSW